jgi:hypothetical protein
MRIIFAIIVVHLMICDAFAQPNVIVADNVTVTPTVWEDIGILSVSSPNRNGQSFRPSNSGLLTNIETYIAGGYIVPSSQPLKVSIHTAVNGIPSLLLGTREFDADNFLPSTNDVQANSQLFESLDMRPLGIHLVAGQDYIATFHALPGVSSNLSSDAPYLIGAYVEGVSYDEPTKLLGTNFSRALNGVNWQVIPVSRHWELALRVNVVPEPSRAALLLSSLFLLLVVRRSR